MIFNHHFALHQVNRNILLIFENICPTCDEVILATDDDREGEAIAWHLCKVLKLSINNTKRIIFHEITKAAIKKAINNPIRVNMDKVQCTNS